MKRSGKFYRKNEKEVMESLGLRPTINSGSTWIEKEDGVNDYLICQLKSTDAQSIRVQQKDIRMLEKNAYTEHKIPIFAIQFLNTGEVWLMAKPGDFQDVAQFLDTGVLQRDTDTPVYIPENARPETRVIKSSSSAREEYEKEREKAFDKTKSAV